MDSLRHTPPTSSVRRRILLAAVAGAIVTVMGCADYDPMVPPDRQTAPLTAGVLDGADSAVVALLLGNHAACTAVLITPRLALTAAHCLVGQSTPPRVLFGSDAAAPVAIVDVTEIFVHAAFNPLSRAHDIAALRLQEDAPAAALGVVETLPLPPPSFVPSAEPPPVRLVGFGHDSDAAPANAPHLKRQGMATITGLAVDSLLLSPAPAQACVGDSGGAVLTTVLGREVLVGLILSGVTSCTETATALRIDAYADAFISPVINGDIPSRGSSSPSAAPPRAGCGIAPHAPGANLFVLAALLFLLWRRTGRGCRSKRRADGF